MKKHISLLVLSVVFLTSCSKEDPSPDIVGEWQIQNADYTVKYIDEEALSETTDYSSSNSSIVFNADGTYTSSIIDDLDSEVLFPVSQGTYTLINDKLTLNYTEDGAESSVFYNAKVNGSSLTLSMNKALFEETLKAEVSAQPELLDFFELSFEELIALFMEEVIQFDASINFTKIESM
jgi:hypothetical protein